MTHIPKIPKISEEERTLLVVTLLEIIHLQQEKIQHLKDEIAQLKGLKPKPQIKPSTLEKESMSEGRKNKGNGKRPSSAKRSKTKKLEIHKTKVIRPDNLLEGSRFKGYQDYTVQDIIIKPNNTLYRLECWITPQGDVVVGKLPKDAQGGHFGKTLICFILYQYYHAHVTQPLILEQLHEWEVDISSGKLSQIITEGKERFHAEKDEILRAGLEVSKYIHVDDTGARHQGNNGYCTHIGNELFAWFESTESKSRINFLKLLRTGNKDYVLNGDVLEYMRAQGLPKVHLEWLSSQQDKTIEGEKEWEATLQAWHITDERHIRIITEGALLGSIIEHGPNPELVIISDDAGQFNVLLHGLCWIHADRSIERIIGFNEQQKAALENTRTQIWDFYKVLKAYKQAPNEKKKAEAEERFEEIFTKKTDFVTLDLALKRLYKNKAELLLVLKYPHIPLHNNLSERDIREYVKKRKISGSTRSANGRRCRDTFTSLKKTCRKQGVSFWEYLWDRVCGIGAIAQLGELIRLRTRASPA